MLSSPARPQADDVDAAEAAGQDVPMRSETVEVEVESSESWRQYKKLTSADERALLPLGDMERLYTLTCSDA